MRKSIACEHKLINSRPVCIVDPELVVSIISRTIQVAVKFQPPLFRPSWALQCVCVCERSTVGIRCIEREEKKGEGGRKRESEKKREEGGEKRRGKMNVTVLGRFSLMPSVVIARGVFYFFWVSARAAQNPATTYMTLADNKFKIGG